MGDLISLGATLLATGPALLATRFVILFNALPNPIIYLQGKRRTFFCSPVPQLDTLAQIGLRCQVSAKVVLGSAATSV